MPAEEPQRTDQTDQPPAHEKRVLDAAERLPEGAPPPKRLSRAMAIVVAVAILIVGVAALWAAHYFGGIPALIVALLLLAAYAVYGARPILVAIFLREKEVGQVERQISKAEHPPETVKREP